MSTTPKVVGEEVVFQNRWITVYKKDVQMGDKVLDCYVVGKDAHVAAILAIDDQDNVYLTQQYRWSVEDTPFDIPGGGVHPGEEPLETAKRELLEETGCTATKIEPLVTRYFDSGQKDATQHIFVATGLKEGVQQLDDTEQIKLSKRNIYKLCDEILAGKHKESTLMIAVLLYLAERSNENTDNH